MSDDTNPTQPPTHEACGPKVSEQTHCLRCDEPSTVVLCKKCRTMVRLWKRLGVSESYD